MAPGLLPALTGVKMINSDHFLAGKKIIVAGAGMAGLSFTIALRKKWSAQAATLPNVSITMYERDTKENTIGREGYSVSIRADSYSGGMQALKKLALLEMAVQVSLIGTKDDDRGFAVWDNQWKELMKLKARTPDADLPAPTMRITRQALRKILVNAISPDDAINWSTSCTGARQLNNGKIQVQLSNGMVEECDILVAADGANSKIRASLRPEDKLRYSGATFICGDAFFPDTGVPEPIKKDWGSVISGTGVGLFISPVSTHKATWSLSYLSPTPRATERQPLTQERAEAILQEALDRGRPYSQPFESIIRATDPFTISVFSAMDKDPFAHIDKLQSYQHIIYIGDSNRKSVLAYYIVSF